MTHDWNDFQLFLAAAETGSFSAAAQRLSLGQPTVSRRIALLEERIGLVLFHRGRRGARLTADGERLVPHAVQMDRWAAELDATIAGRESAPVGIVTITAPPGVAADVLVPFAIWLRGEHPALRLSVLSGVDYLDLTRGQADIAIRIKPSDDPALVTVASFSAPVAPMAAPAYAETLSPSATLADLDWIGWSPALAHLPPHRNLAEVIGDFEPVFASDSFLLQLQACEAGLGALFLPRYGHRDFLDRGLVELDVAYPSVAGSVYLVCARSVRYVPRVSAVLEALETWIEDGRNAAVAVSSD